MQRLCSFYLVSMAAVLVCCASGCGGKQPNEPATVIKVNAGGEAKPILPPPASDTAYESSPSDRRDVRDASLLNWPPVQQWGLPETAADALSRIGEPAVPALVSALSDPDPKVRLQAARALARIGPPARDAVPALTRALDDTDLAVRANAARALGQIGPNASSAVPDLIRSLK
jgi:transglutaminase-like putative cysteine protease